MGRALGMEWEEMGGEGKVLSVLFRSWLACWENEKIKNTNINQLTNQ